MAPLLVDPLEFPHALSSVPLEILCPQSPPPPPSPCIMCDVFLELPNGMEALEIS